VKIDNRQSKIDNPANAIANAKDFRRVLERANIERVELPSGLSVLLCRPPVFAALEMGRTGTQLQAKVTDAKPEAIKAEDIEAFTRWLSETLTRLFVEPRFAPAPTADEIGLADILIDDLKFIFRWLRGEVFSAGTRDSGLGTGVNPSPQPLAPSPCSEDLGRFPGGHGADFVPGGGGEAQPVPPERTAGADRHAGLSAGLHCR
jgi:hypothetical protein